MRRFLLVIAFSLVASLGLKAQDTLLVRSADEYKLFAPFTFYHDVSRRLFTPQLKGEKTEIKSDFSPILSDSILTRYYIAHPELIQNTQNRIKEAGSIESGIDRPIRHRFDFVGQSTSSGDVGLPSNLKVFVTKPRFWVIKGDYSLQFMQNYVSGNWYKGGESNYSLLGSISMEANYNNRHKIIWDNKLELKLGVQNSRSDSVHALKTTEDLIRLTSKLGLKASNKWYYTLQMIASTQFTHSYKVNDPVLYADFLSPFNLNLSVGMDYNIDWLDHSLKGTVHLAPLAYNCKYSRLLELSERLGIQEGSHVLHDFGSQFTIDFTWELSDQIRWKSRAYAYTSYKRVEMEWENTFVFQLNKWMAAQLFVYPRYDDGISRDVHHGFWQFKEYASIGFNYSF